ncbi:MAG TPA: DUF4912 domain-containing protein [Pyrinomonadaceae bacterium]|nr:DUF4912 domain-containing protein [Pyrinomonadaceae bacterium]
MATKGRTTQKKVSKAPVAKVSDPFESTVEAAPVVSGARSARPARERPVEVTAKPIASTKPDTQKPRVKKAAPKSVIEPFAERVADGEAQKQVVDSPTQPVKRSPKPAKAKAATAKATSPAKRASKTRVSPTTASVTEENLSPVFKALADVKLPELAPSARARLLVQSPTRLYLYWSLRQDPWQQLRAVFGSDLGSYTLVLKLRNITHDTEEIYPAERQGEWWFNAVLPDCEYAAEIGFYATNRPYFRVLYSNSVSTPRSSPSPHPASEARWTVSATKFAEVLDASGFTRDAIDVAIAGDDLADAEERTRAAFAEFTGSSSQVVSRVPAEELRHALIAVASGATAEDLRAELPPSLFELLQASVDLDAASARKALASHFEVDEEEWTEHQYGPAVFGASSIHFPKTLKPRKGVKYSPRYNPVSSFSIGR